MNSLGLLRAAAILLAASLAPAPADAADTAPPPVAPSTVRHVDAGQARKLLAGQPVVVLDIRTPDEFESGHLSGATNINYMARDFESLVAKLDRSQTYLVHCATGRRSSRSLATFEKLKFQNVYHLEGGIVAWEKQGLPVTR